MSRFFSSKFDKLTPYTPGEQPRTVKYIKLNTNESPFPPSPSVAERVAAASEKLNLYSDIECVGLRERLSALTGYGMENILITNGSDEALNFAFMAFGDEKHPFVFPNYTYGFYPVFSELNLIPYREIPLRDDFTIDPEDYIGCGCNIAIANPNAPTGIPLPVGEIERIIAGNPDNVVIIDEAYVDFGGESCLPLVGKYDNLLVCQTFSKSRSMAGARLGFAVGARELIADLNTIKFSTNPYNVNSLSAAAGEAALDDNEYYMENCRTIIKTRERVTAALTELGFRVLPSGANFIFADSSLISGEDYYLKLRERGVLVRYFSKKGIENFVRITIGTDEQMDVLISKTEEILKERAGA